MLNAVRATGATNVVLVGSMQYSQDLSGWLANKPIDTLNPPQMAAAGNRQPRFQHDRECRPTHNRISHRAFITTVKNILAAGILVIATENGDRNAAGTEGAPLVSTITQFADANGVSLLGWTWDVWFDRDNTGIQDNVLIKDVDGTPTDGYGVVFRKTGRSQH